MNRSTRTRSGSLFVDGLTALFLASNLLLKLGDDTEGNIRRLIVYRTRVADVEGQGPESCGARDSAYRPFPQHHGAVDPRQETARGRFYVALRTGDLPGEEQIAP